MFVSESFTSTGAFIDYLASQFKADSKLAVFFLLNCETLLRLEQDINEPVFSLSCFLIDAAETYVDLFSGSLKV
jgi:hypothetical protein